MPAALNAKGLPGQKLECKNDDPSCDHSLGDNICAFQLSMCFNVQESRFPCLSPNNVAKAQINRPSARSQKKIDKTNRDAIVSGLLSVGAVSQGTCVGPNQGQACSLSQDCDSVSGSGDGFCPVKTFTFSPSLTTSTCSQPMLFRIALKKNGTRLVKTRQRFRIRFFPAAGHHDGDLIDLVCIP